MLKKKKIILITGGSRGIGKSIAIKLGKNNNFVIITYKKNKNYAQKVVEEIKVNGGEAFSIKMDISCEISINETIENIKCKYDSVDILVNNAGISQEKPFLDISIRDWEEMLRTNLTSAFYLSKLCIPKMVQNKWGRIINISSIGGQWGGFNQVHYAASKAGLISLTQSLAKIYSKDGITTNAIAPGLISTDMVSNELNTEHGKNKVKNIPIGRIGNAVEVASAVEFLVSEEAAYITGQTLNLNGGMLFS